MSEDLDKAVSKLGYDVATKFKIAINKAVKHKDAGGQESALAGSVKVVLLNSSDSVGFKITMNEYWDYFNSGVDGTVDKVAKTNKSGGRFAFKKKNINTEWVKDKVTLKKISGKMTKEKRAESYDKKLKSARFLIGRSMALHGIEPHPFYNEVVNDTNRKEWKDIIVPFVKKEMALILK